MVFLDLARFIVGSFERSSKPEYDWNSVIIALLIALAVLLSFFVVQFLNDWMRRFVRARQRQSQTPPREITGL